MVDIGKQIQYWKEAAIEDWDVAKQLLIYPPTMQEANAYFNRGREVFQWLMK